MTHIKINSLLYPATISNYSITTEEVEQMFLEFCSTEEVNDYGT